MKSMIVFQALHTMTRAVHGRLGTWYLFFCVSLAYALTVVVVVVVVVLRFDNPLSLIFDSAIGFFSNYA